MEQQKILRKRVVDLLGLKLTSEEGVNLFRNSEFQFDDEDMLLMPHVKKPLKIEINTDTSSEAVYQNAVNVYEAYKSLTPLEAADPRFWNYLSLVEYYSLVRKRWSSVYERKEKEGKGKEYIEDHFFVTGSGSLMRCWLSGFWWTAFLSIDEDNIEDPYHLTKVMCWNETLRTRTMGTGLFARNKNVAHGFLDYLKERGKDSFGSFDDEHREITKYLNLVGGTRPLSFFTREDIKNIIMEKFPISVSKDAEED